MLNKKLYLTDIDTTIIKPTIYNKFTLSNDYYKRIEPCGKYYEILKHKQYNIITKECDAKQLIINNNIDSDEDIETDDQKAINKILYSQNHQEILGLINKQLIATEEEIKKK